MSWTSFSLNLSGLSEVSQIIGKTLKAYSTVSTWFKLPSGLIDDCLIKSSSSASLSAVSTIFLSEFSFLPPGKAIWPLWVG